MTKRLQVTLRDTEYRAIQCAARSRYRSIVAWVRQAPDLARRREPEIGVSKKLGIIRAASRFDFPTGDLQP